MERHLTDAELSRWTSGEGVHPEETEAWSRHVESCGECAELALALKGSLADPATPIPEPAMRGILDAAGLPPRPRFRLLRWAIPAAAAAGILLSLFLPLPERAPPFTSVEPRLPAGQRMAAEAEIRVAPDGAAVSFHLPGGSRFRADPGTTLAIRPAAGGAGSSLLLARGSVEAEVAKADAGLRIVSDAGEIRVTGTRLLARAFRLHGASAFAVLSAEVVEGEIVLAGPSGTLRVPAGTRGILRSGEPPVLQEARPLDWRAKALQWEPSLASAEGAPSWEAAVLLVNGRDGGIDWRKALERPAEPAALRAVAARLLALAAEPEDAAFLADRLKREADPAVRAALLPALKRLLPESPE